MTKIKNKNKIIGLLSVMLLLVSLIGIFPIKVNAAAADITVTIDTGIEITLKDLDGNSYYDIGTADELYAFAAEVNGGNGSINGELTADIVVNENVLDENGELNGDGSNFRVWTPIGLYVDSYDAATVFHGQFNGNNHTVSGLYFNDETKERVGLFGATNGASIQNVGVFDCYINGYLYVGGVVGYLRSGTLRNCYNTGGVLGYDTLGGVAGWAGKSSTIQNCFNTGNVISEKGTTGGVVGYIYDTSNTTTLKNCYSTGNVVLLGEHSVGSSAPGTTGGVIGSVGNNTVENCFFLENTVTIEGKVSNGSVKTGTQAMSFAQFASGEVAYKLGSAFGQTLNGENRQNYPVLGGTPVTASERFEIYGQQLNLGSDLSMKYYVTAYTEGFDPAHLQMQFIHNGVVTTPEYKIIDGFYVFTLDGINPQCMGDSIFATLFYEGEEVTKHGYDENYSVEINLNNLLEEYKDDATLVILINDLLAYGKAASDYKKYPSITEDYKGSDREIPDGSIASSSFVTGYTVVFGQMNFIKIKVELVEGYVLYLDDVDITNNLDTNGVYRTDGIAPTDFDKEFVFTIKNGGTVIDTYTVSVNDYISAKKNDAAMANLVNALYNYGASAEIYKHAKTGEGEHTYTYIDNGDGTHTPVCQYCDYINIAEAEVHTFENGKCVCGKYEVTIDLSTFNATYVINDNRYYEFIGSGSYGIKVESGNPGIVLNNASITVGEGSAIDIASGCNVTIFVLGDNTIGTTKTGNPGVPCGGIFVAEGGTVNITSNGTDNILRAHGTLAAAIGGKYDYDNNESYNAGNINISNVTVYAYTNNFYASAIGAAGEGTCGTINITNAVVYVYGAGDQWTSAPGIGSAWSLVGGSDTIPVVIISDSEVHTFRHNSGSDYIGYLGDVEMPTNATGSINCGEGGSVKSSTIYCYTGLDATMTDKVVTYNADGTATEN